MKIDFLEPYWLLPESADEETAFAVVVTSVQLHENNLGMAAQLLKNNKAEVLSEKPLSRSAIEYVIKITTQQAWALQQKLLFYTAKSGLDLFIVPIASRMKKLLVCDMDSTIVNSETLDDVAEKAGVGEEVSKITERAMQGELDFREALQERLGLLKGRSVSLFDELIDSIEFNVGAESLIEYAKHENIRTVLVSGGFEPIVRTVAEKLDFDHYVCNSLDTEGDQISGNLLEPIVDSDTKLNVLKEEVSKLGIKHDEVCAIGDGANDIPMLQAAGLGIVYRGKPVVKGSIPYQLNVSSLECVLFVLGFD